MIDVEQEVNSIQEMALMFFSEVTAGSQNSMLDILGELENVGRKIQIRHK